MIKKHTCESAKREAKKYFGECIFCGDENISGCHIFPAGETRYEHLAAVQFNIIAACDMHHKHMDARSLGFMSTHRARRPWARLRIIKRHCLQDHKARLESWLFILRQIVRESRGIK